MRVLPEQQTAFGDALTLGVSPTLGRFFHDAPEKLERRFDAYRRNFWSNHRSAMTATYRVVELLVGPVVFRDLATAYIAAHPSHDADLNMYGGGFGDFLATQPLAQRYAYLPDVARLEWALLVAYGAADAPTFDLAALATVPPEQQGAIRLVLRPGLALLDADYPLADIWHAHQIEDVARRDEVLASIDLTSSPTWTLVARDAANTVAPRALSIGSGAFCRACLDGDRLDEALAAALAVEPSLDIAHLLPTWIGQGLIAGFRTD